MTKRTITDNAEDATTIVNTSIATDAARDPEAAMKDDDRRWISTVITSLKGRSPQAQQALLKALQNGHTNTDPLGCAIILGFFEKPHLPVCQFCVGYTDPALNLRLATGCKFLCSKRRLKGKSEA